LLPCIAEKKQQAKTSEVSLQICKACFEQHNKIKLSQLNYPMNFNIATILAGLAILFVLITYITTAPLLPLAVILLGLAIILGGRGTNLRP
jgi:hypothetical protein